MDPRVVGFLHMGGDDLAKKRFRYVLIEGVAN